MKLTPSFFRRACIALLLAVATGCAQNPVSGKQNLALVSEADEIRIGKQGDLDIKKEYGFYDLPKLQEYVDMVGQKLARNSHRSNLEFHFTVVDSPEINAFALPGGYIYITRGLLAYLNSEAELAAVLGHEIGHVTARHSVQQMSAAYAADIAVQIASIFAPELGSAVGRNLVNVLGGALLSGYGREHELEADRLGAQYLAKTGYDPQAMVQVIRVLKNQELFDAEIAKQEGREPRAYHGLFATHPDNDTRLKEVVGEAAQWAQPGATLNKRAEFLAQSDGLVYGDDPRQGVIRGNVFYHTDLGFSLTFPPDWRIKNQPDRLLAGSPDSEAMIELKMAEGSKESPADLLRRLLNLTTTDELEATTVNGLQAAFATVRRQARPIRAGAVILNGNAYLMVGGGASAAAFERRLKEIDGTLHSFRALDDAERKQVKPLHITTVQAKPGTTYAKLAQRSPLGKNAEGILRLLNAMYPSGEPAAGQTVKVVE
ncbi:MAG: M48 family metalloprotease [Pseudomonadota bacterium]